MDGYSLQGRMYEARNVFDSMASINAAPDIFSYSILINGYCRKIKVDDAMDIFREMPRKVVRPNLHISYYNIVMDGLCEAKMLDAARAIFRELASKGLEPDVVTCNIMIKGCCQTGLLKEAKDILLKIEQACLLPKEFTYNSIIQGNLKGGKVEDASKFLEEMDAKGLSLDASTFELLLDALGMKKKILLFLK